MNPQSFHCLENIFISQRKKPFVVFEHISWLKESGFEHLYVGIFCVPNGYQSAIIIYAYDWIVFLLPYIWKHSLRSQSQSIICN